MRALMDCKDMTVKELLDRLTDENYHTERMVVEAIMTEDWDCMKQACIIWQAHQTYGYLPNGLGDMRRELWGEIEEKLGGKK